MEEFTKQAHWPGRRLRGFEVKLFGAVFAFAIWALVVFFSFDFVGVVDEAPSTYL